MVNCHLIFDLLQLIFYLQFSFLHQNFDCEQNVLVVLKNAFYPLEHALLNSYGPGFFCSDYEEGY